jgi:RNA polymerase sigma-70 factor (ECF subfamily)
MNERERQFSQIFAENRNRIYRLCHTYLDNRNLVDDLFQEIWLHIWRSLPSFRGEAQVSTWAYRIAVNTALLFNQQTRRKRAETPLDGVAGQRADGRRSPEEAAGKSQRLAQLRQAIAALPGPDRLLITLYLEGTSYRELSEIIGSSVNHVGVRLNRIRQALGKIMEKI